MIIVIIMIKEITTTSIMCHRCIHKCMYLNTCSLADPPAARCRALTRGQVLTCGPSRSSSSSSSSSSANNNRSSNSNSRCTNNDDDNNDNNI